MTWVFGYLIGIILCVVVLYLTGFDCDNGDPVFLLSVGWPLLLISFLICCCGVFFIEIYSYIKDKKLRNEYFYCKYGGCMPLCSDCRRNHINSDLNTKSIQTWFIP